MSFVSSDLTNIHIPNGSLTTAQEFYLTLSSERLVYLEILEDEDGDEDGGIVPSCLAQALTLFSFQIQIRMKMTEMTEMMGMMGMMTRKTTMPTMMVG